MSILNIDNCPYSNRHGEYGGMSGLKDGVIINGEKTGRTTLQIPKE